MQRVVLGMFGLVGVIMLFSITHGFRKARIMVEEVDGKRLEVKVDGALFARYHFSQEQPRPFFHPVVGPFGDSIVRGYPVTDVPGESRDHVHHKGHWFTHGDVNGVDFWADGRGRIVHRSFETVAGGDFGHIRERNDWVAPDGRKVLEEVRDVKVYDFAPGRLFAWEVTLKAVNGDVKMGDTKEGSFAVRVASTMEGRNGGRIENTEGKVGEKTAWGKQSPWCDYAGTVNGKTVGVAIFDHPQNFRPAYYHTREYGLHAANPFGTAAYTGDKTKDGSYTIPGGRSLTLRYALYVHPGDVKEGEVAEQYQRWVTATP